MSYQEEIKRLRAELAKAREELNADMDAKIEGCTILRDEEFAAIHSELIKAREEVVEAEKARAASKADLNRYKNHAYQIFADLEKARDALLKIGVKLDDPDKDPVYRAQLYAEDHEATVEDWNRLTDELAKERERIAALEHGLALCGITGEALKRLVGSERKEGGA